MLVGFPWLVSRSPARGLSPGSASQGNNFKLCAGLSQSCSALGGSQGAQEGTQGQCLPWVWVVLPLGVWSQDTF